MRHSPSPRVRVICIVHHSCKFHHNEAIFESTPTIGGVFCLATHYWEQDAPSLHASDTTVGAHLRRLIERAVSHPRVVWRAVGAVVSANPLVA
jgi:hypothetical protein